MSEPLLRLQDVSRQFNDPARTVGLRAITLDLQPGDFCAIVGSSGAGKSTLLNILGMLDRPTAGRYLVAGEDTASLRPRMRDRLRAITFGFVFQDANLLPERTAYENVELKLRTIGIPPGSRAELIDRALEDVGVSHRRDALARTLSGGERQRVAVARSIVNRPLALLADEPTGNLDRTNASHVIDLLSAVHRAGTTVVVTTHDESVASASGRRVRIVDGRIDLT